MDKTTEFRKANQKQYPYVESVELRQRRSLVDERYTSDVTMVLANRVCEDPGVLRLVIVFRNVRAFKFAQGDWSVVKLPLLEVKNVAARGWEGVKYEVRDNENGVVSFLCQDFDIFADSRDTKDEKSIPAKRTPEG
jgi:hypothetical protein